MATKADGLQDLDSVERPDWAGFTESQRRFLAVFRNYGVIRSACKIAHVSRFHLWEWRRDNAEFLRAFDAAREESIELMEEEAKKRAVSKSDVLLIFLLKAARPEVYRDNLKVDFTSIPDRELESRIAFLAGKAGIRSALDGTN